jgi:hypothetical protein
MFKSSVHFMATCLLISFLVALFGTLMREYLDQRAIAAEHERMVHLTD